jgi:hypothetical protein
VAEQEAAGDHSRCDAISLDAVAAALVNPSYDDIMPAMLVMVVGAVLCRWSSLCLGAS